MARSEWQPEPDRKKRAFYAILIVLCAAIFLVSAGVLIRYGAQWMRSRQESAALKALYYAAENGSTEAPAPTPEPTVAPTALPAATATPQVTAVPTAAPTPTREPWLSTYPDNPYRTVRERISKLQRVNKDIIGWLKLGDLLEEAVVQRDNSYYLRRDYKGYHNDNGALFLEEHCDLSNQPAVYMIFGHNMKTGAMFGCLRNWENTNFYHKNPQISFESKYETGEYVIFAVSTLTETEVGTGINISMQKDAATVRALTERLLTALTKSSIYTNMVDVTADDQLLLLVTCTKDDSDRRVVAARRIREGEDREALFSRVRMNQKKK